MIWSNGEREAHIDRAKTLMIGRRLGLSGPKSILWSFYTSIPLEVTQFYMSEHETKYGCQSSLLSPDDFVEMRVELGREKELLQSTRRRWQIARQLALSQDRFETASGTRLERLPTPQGEIDLKSHALSAQEGHERLRDLKNSITNMDGVLGVAEREVLGRLVSIDALNNAQRNAVNKTAISSSYSSLLRQVNVAFEHGFSEAEIIYLETARLAEVFFEYNSLPRKDVFEIDRDILRLEEHYVLGMTMSEANHINHKMTGSYEADRHASIDKITSAVTSLKRWGDNFGTTIKTHYQTDTVGRWGSPSRYFPVGPKSMDVVLGLPPYIITQNRPMRPFSSPMVISSGDLYWKLCSVETGYDVLILKFVEAKRVDYEGWVSACVDRSLNRSSAFLVGLMASFYATIGLDLGQGIFDAIISLYLSEET